MGRRNKQRFPTTDPYLAQKKKKKKNKKKKKQHQEVVFDISSLPTTKPYEKKQEDVFDISNLKITLLSSGNREITSKKEEKKDVKQEEKIEQTSQKVRVALVDGANLVYTRNPQSTLNKISQRNKLVVVFSKAPLSHRRGDEAGNHPPK